METPNVVLVMVILAVLEDVELLFVTLRTSDEDPDNPDVLLTVSQDELLDAVQLTPEETVIDEEDCAVKSGAQLEVLTVMVGLTFA